MKNEDDDDVEYDDEYDDEDDDEDDEENVDKDVDGDDYDGDDDKLARVHGDGHPGPDGTDLDPGRCLHR